MLSLKSSTPQPLLDEPLEYSPTGRSCELYDTSQSSILSRGQRFFDTVYGKISKRVMSQMDRSGTEDLGIVARTQYGYILSNTCVLSASESSFVIMAGLIPQDVSQIYVYSLCSFYSVVIGKPSIEGASQGSSYLQLLLSCLL